MVENWRWKLKLKLKNGEVEIMPFPYSSVGSAGIYQAFSHFVFNNRRAFRLDIDEVILLNHFGTPRAKASWNEENDGPSWQHV